MNDEQAQAYFNARVVELDRATNDLRSALDALYRDGKIDQDSLENLKLLTDFQHVSNQDMFAAMLNLMCIRMKSKPRQFEQWLAKTVVDADQMKRAVNWNGRKVSHLDFDL